jgi:hypothetical protein
MPSASFDVRASGHIQCPKRDISRPNFNLKLDCDIDFGTSSGLIRKLTPGKKSNVYETGTSWHSRRQRPSLRHDSHMQNPQVYFSRESRGSWWTSRQSQLAHHGHKRGYTLQIPDSYPNEAASNMPNWHAEVLDLSGSGYNEWVSSWSPSPPGPSSPVVGHTKTIPILRMSPSLATLTDPSNNKTSHCAVETLRQQKLLDFQSATIGVEMSCR